MKKTQIIKQIVGEKLKDYGFTYLKTDGPCRIFVREVQGIKRYYDPENQVVKQYINIQESSFSHSLTARFHTDAYGYKMDEGLEALRKYGTGEWLTYLNEESYKERLRLIADLIVEHGFDVLEKMSHEEETIPTKAMAEKLFDEHKQLADSFAKEYALRATPEQPEDIDEWLDSIKRILKDSADLPYEEVKELLTKISAFIGEKACEIGSYKWNFPDYFDTPQVTGAYPHPTLWPLDVVVRVWTGNDLFWQFIERLGEVLKQDLVKRI